MLAKKDVCLVVTVPHHQPATGTVAEVVAAALPVAIGGTVDVTFIFVAAFSAIIVGAVTVGPAILSW